MKYIQLLIWTDKGVHQYVDAIFSVSYTEDLHQNVEDYHRGLLSRKTRTMTIDNSLWLTSWVFTIPVNLVR